MAVDFIRIGDQNDILGESPIWRDSEQALYWVDIRAPAIRRLAYATGSVRTWPMPDLVGCVAFADDGRLLVALPDRIALFDPSDGALLTVATPPTKLKDHRFNDGRCDRQGRFWVGSMNNVTRAPKGVLYRLDPDGLRPVRTGISIPNSLCWSPDGRTMYFSDSLGYAISAFAFEPTAGEIGAETTLATTVKPGFPDGSAVDAEGFLWNAEFNASRVVRYAPDGRIDRIVETPVDRPTCCAFGGPELDILYVTSTCQNMSQEEREAAPLAGALFAMRLDVKGLPESRCDLARLQLRSKKEAK